MTVLSKEQETAVALVASMKMTQRGILKRLREEAHAAQKAGDVAKAKQLTKQVIALTRQNLVLHRARQKVLRAQDLDAVNQQLMRIVADSNKTLGALENTVKLLEQAAKYIGLVRRMIDALT